uniref:Uncharacterized protein n=1 Tax=mine drainage metagenome TaxID=410659 RepID=E6QRQ6_9ZZZZ
MPQNSRIDFSLRCLLPSRVSHLIRSRENNKDGDWILLAQNNPVHSIPNENVIICQNKRWFCN